MERKGKNSLIKSLALAAVLILGTGLSGCSGSDGKDGKSVNMDDVTQAVLDELAGEETITLEPRPEDEELAGQPRGDYVGSAACVECHSGEHAGWAGTVHGKMIQVANEDTMAPWAREQFEDLLANDPDSIYLGIGRDGWRGQLQSMDQIRYVVGGKWKQRYVVKSDEGHVFLRYQYYWSKADGTHDHWSEGDDRDDRWHDYGGNSRYEDNCLACHSTGFDLDRANSLDRAAADYTLGSVVTELGVGCESCHGPGKDHIASEAKADIENPANFTVDQQVQFCGSCHGRSDGNLVHEGRGDAYGFELGATDLHEHVKILNVTDGANSNVEHTPGVGYFVGSSLRFWGDDASRSHRMQYNDFIQGPHYGKLSCSDCHDPHRSTPLQKDNALETCNKCHGYHKDGGDYFDDTNNCSACHNGTTYRAFETEDLEEWKKVARGRNFTEEDLAVIMPKKAESSNRPDIHTHTFLFGAIGKADPAVPRSDDGEQTLKRVKELNETASYVGSNTCLVCHGDKRGWAETIHGDMIQRVDHSGGDATRLDTMAPFALEAFHDAIDNDVNTDVLGIGDGGELGSITGITDIKYVVGGKWKQRYVVKDDQGHRFLTHQYYFRDEGSDPHWSDSDFDPSKSYWAGYNSNTTYEENCLACHSTGMNIDLIKGDNALDRTAPNYRLESVVAEFGVGCESCHGPGSLHTAGGGYSDNIVNPANFKAVEQFDACGSCHARAEGGSNKHHEGRTDAFGFLIGDHLDDHVIVSRWDNQPGRFHDDGASRSHRMQYNDMELGPKNGMSCYTCHDVHNNDALKLKGKAKATDSTADKFDALCASCHGPTHGYELNTTMKMRASSGGTQDIRTHTFILDEAGEAVGGRVVDE